MIITTKKSTGFALAAGILISGHSAFAASLVTDSGPVSITSAVTADPVWIGQNASGTSLTINAGGTLTDTSATIGVNAGATANTATVSGTGATWNNGTGNLNVGFYGANNALSVGNGGSVTAGLAELGVFSGADGNGVTISGSGRMNLSGDMIVGLASNTNSLTVQSGGALSGVNGFVGDNATSGNTATVTGANSVWTASGALYVSPAGSNNLLTISNGGKVAVNASDALIGANAGASGNEILVTGAGSVLSNLNGTLYVGRSGTGNSLHIQSGGLVSGKNVRIGGGTGTNGTTSGNGAYVDGSGSVWNVAGTLRDGSDGANSTLQITNGGVVNVTGNTFLGYNATSTGNSLLVSGAGSQLNAHALTIGNVAGSTGNTVTVGTGGALQASSLAVGGGNTLEVDGTGTAVITGSGAYFTMASTGTLAIGVAASGNGLLTVAGTATLAGELNLIELPGFSFPAGSESYTIVDYTSVSGDFSSAAVNGNLCQANGADSWSCGSLNVTEGFTGSRLTLSLTDVPEPGTMALLGAGLIGLGTIRRHRRA
jgi:T5SS/PEP-CTERM-associated repeat protein